jgi:hypothetical protein
MQDQKMNQNINAIVRQAHEDRGVFLRALFSRLFDRKTVAKQFSHS